MFEPVTSYGALSSLSLDQIMSDRPPYLHTKYLQALNIQNHVDQKKYAADIAILQKIEHTYSEIYKYLQKYTDRNDKVSVFSKLVYAISSFNDFFRKDRDTHLFGDLPAMIEAFNRIFLTPRMTLITELRNVATSYRLFLQLNNNAVSNSTIDSVTDSSNLNTDGTFNGTMNQINDAIEKVRNYGILATELTDPRK